MTVMVCIDDNGGMLFNHRRQSQDSVLRKRMLAVAGGQPLYMNAYTAKQFAGEEDRRVMVTDDFLVKAGDADYAFAEDQPLAPYANRIDTLIVYKWNRRYPSDQTLDIDLTGWKRTAVYEFAGSSHEKITEEVYVR